MRIGQSVAILLVSVFVLPSATFAQVCGNGIREGAEQCDDGNTVNLDGCSATCTFEQVQRVNQLNMQFGAPGTSCPANALGGAFGSFAQGPLQTAINGSVADGSTSALIYFLGLGDLSGQSAPSIELGLVNGMPMSTAGGYNGASDVDWWYLPDVLGIDSARLPTDRVSGNITTGHLSGAGGVFGLRTNLGGTLTTLQMSSLLVKADIGASSTPMSYNGSATQGHLPVENLDPGLTSFQAASNGILCSNINAASLAATAIPPAFVTGGTIACSQNYSPANSALDMLVGGCTAFGFVTVVQATQPDTSDAGATPAGAGAPYHLIASTASRIVDTCKDHTAATVDFATCLNAAAYSSFFSFSTDRVIFTNDLIFRDGFE